jgi:peptide/nickel transport system ATP-binding protein
MTKPHRPEGRRNAPHRRAQIVFQICTAAQSAHDRRCDARGTAFSIPFKEQGEGAVSELLRPRGLAPEHAGRYPHEFSGGVAPDPARRSSAVEQADRVRRPVSALDVSIQAR